MNLSISLSSFHFTISVDFTLCCSWATHLIVSISIHVIDSNWICIHIILNLWPTIVWILSIMLEQNDQGIHSFDLKSFHIDTEINSTSFCVCLCGLKFISLNFHHHNDGFVRYSLCCEQYSIVNLFTGNSSHSRCFSFVFHCHRHCHSMCLKTF